MRYLTLVSIATAAVLALACVYLARQVELERDRADAETERRLDLQARVDHLKRERQLLVQERAGAGPSSVGSRPNAGQPTPAEAEGTAPLVGNATPETKPFDAQRHWRSRMLQDPAGRELLRAQERADIQAANPHLARDLQLTEVQHDRLLDLLVEQAMEASELFARMRGTYDVEEFRQLRANHYHEVAALLGYEKAQRYRDYEASEPERRQIRQFRARLDEANTLSDDQAARLVASWQDERKRFRKELEQRYAGYDVGQTMGTWYGGDFMASESLGTPPQEQFLEQLEAYNRQLSHAARSILTPRQFEVFSQIQEERLVQERTRAWVVTNGLE